MINEVISYLQLDTLLYRLLAFLIAATLHDCVYALTTSLLGDRTAREQGRLSANPMVHIAPFGLAMVLFGPYGWTKPMPVDPKRFSKSPRASSIVVWLAAPIANLLLGIVFWFLYMMFIVDSTQISIMGEFWSGFLQFSVIANLLYAFIHLIPLYPLGGWYALRSFLGREPYGTLSRNSDKAGRRFTLWEAIGLSLTILLMAVPLGRWLTGQLYVIVERWISILFGI